jgi:hypothetical protein
METKQTLSHIEVRKVLKSAKQRKWILRSRKATKMDSAQLYRSKLNKMQIWTFWHATFRLSCSVCSQRSGSN